MAKKAIIPSFAYPGAKARLARRLCALLPPKGIRYVDPFCGRANMFFAVTQLLDYKHFWLNDLGKETNQFLHDLMHSAIWAVPAKSGELFYRMKARQLGRVEPYKDRKGNLRPGGWKGGRQAMVSPAPLLSAYLTFSGAGYMKGGQRTGRGGVSRKGYEQKVRQAYEIMRRTVPHITRLPYQKVLAACHEDDVVFLDPPYKDANVKAYSDKTVDYRGLVDNLLNAKFRWMLTEYNHKVYRPLTKKFGPPVKIRVQRTMTNIHQVGRKWATECIWRNFT